MNRVAIVTDSASDLSPQLQQQHGITVVPLIVRFGHETFLDGQMSLDDFWAKVHGGSAHPETSQPSVGSYEEAYRTLIEQGYDVLSMAVTSKHSGTYNSAYAAAQAFPGQVAVFDTLSLSNVQGYQAIAAARLAREGRSLQDIVTVLEGIRARTCVFIQLDTIEFLRRGGRASQTMPALEKLVRFLSIKPLLSMPDGQLKPFGATRSLEKGMARIMEEIGKRMPAEQLIVLHTRLPEEADKFAQRLADQFGFATTDILITEAGPVLSSHAGPGVIAGAVVSRS